MNHFQEREFLIFAQKCKLQISRDLLEALCDNFKCAFLWESKSKRDEYLITSFWMCMKKNENVKKPEVKEWQRDNWKRKWNVWNDETFIMQCNMSDAI
jgi:hypothetical protein